MRKIIKFISFTLLLTLLSLINVTVLTNDDNSLSSINLDNLLKLSYADDEQEPPKKYVVFTHEENGNCFHCIYAFGFEYEAICPAQRITFHCVEDDSGYTNCSAPNEINICPTNEYDCTATGNDC